MYGNREKGDSVFIFFIKSALENISGAKIPRFYNICISFLCPYFCIGKKEKKTIGEKIEVWWAKKRKWGKKIVINLDMGRLSSLIEH